MASTIVQEHAKLAKGQNLDHMIEQCKKRWDKDERLKQDTEVFVNKFYQCLVSQNKGKSSEELMSYAKAYVYNRYESLAVEQLARQKIPRNSAEYIAKKAFSESLIGLGVDVCSKTDAFSDKVNEKAEELYNPSAFEVGAGWVGSSALDAAVTGGVGGVTSAVTKGVGVASTKMASKFALKNMTKYMTTDLAIRGAFYYGNKTFFNEEGYGDIVFGDTDAIKKIQEGSRYIKRDTSGYIYTINDALNKKIKGRTTSESHIIKKEEDSFYSSFKGDASKMMKGVTRGFDVQAVHYNAQASVPGWMKSFSKQKCMSHAAAFYSTAMNMSKRQQDYIFIGGKRMTRNEVAQRAYDYAHAAAEIEKHPAQKKQGTKRDSEDDSWDKNMAALNNQINAEPVRHSTTMSSNPYTISTVQPQQNVNMSANRQQAQSGWGDALEQLGLNGFSDVSKNLGYVLAMLPDMIIGMFTGKNPDMKFQDNLMPVAAIAAGMFVKNPLLKMLLMGFGGANLLNKAGHAALSNPSLTTSKTARYQQYENEPLNPRIEKPVLKGRSMLATIDGVPSVITISDNVIDAYEKGAIPLNTLANAVLSKYDNNMMMASQGYDRHMSEEEQRTNNYAIK